MNSGIWVVGLILAAMLIYVVAKVLFYMKRSDAQWREVDKSKLRVWKDDDD